MGETEGMGTSIIKQRLNYTEFGSFLSTYSVKRELAGFLWELDKYMCLRNAQ